MSNSLGSRIRDSREARGLSASDLAGLVGVTPTAVWNWEKNGITPRPIAMESIAKTLGVTSEYLRDGKREETANVPVSVPDVLAKAEIEIASLIGVSAGRVKVRFEVLPG